MSALLSMHGASDLTTYADIRNAYKEYLDAKTAYWRDLDEKVAAIHEGLGEHLGIKDATWFDGRRDQLYLALGVVDPVDKFVELQNIDDLQSDKESVLFALRVTLDLEEMASNKQHVVISFAMRRAGQSYFLVIECGKNRLETSIPKTFSKVEQTNLFEVISRFILGQLEYSKYT